MLAPWPSEWAGIANHLQTIRGLNHGESLTGAIATISVVEASVVEAYLR